MIACVVAQILLGPAGDIAATAANWFGQESVGRVITLSLGLYQPRIFAEARCLGTPKRRENTGPHG